MSDIFDYLADKEDERLKKEGGLITGLVAGGVAGLGKKLITNPMATATGVGTILDVAGGARKSRQIASNLAGSVARAPTMVGPTY